MLKEVNVTQAIGAMIEGREVLALDDWSTDGYVVKNLATMLHGLRFLVDEEHKPMKPAEEKPKKEGPQKDCQSKEQEILKAWNGGTRNIKEIMAITGASYNTVRKYIPINEKG